MSPPPPSNSLTPVPQTVPQGQSEIRFPSGSVAQSQVADVEEASRSHSLDSNLVENGRRSGTTEDSNETIEPQPLQPEEYDAPLQYFHLPNRKSTHSANSSLTVPNSNGSGSPSIFPPEQRSPSVPLTHSNNNRARTTIVRPASAYTLSSDPTIGPGGRQRISHSPHISVNGTPSPPGSLKSFSPGLSAQQRRSPDSFSPGLSAQRRSPDNRPVSYIDLLNSPYAQQVAPASSLGAAQLRNAIGNNAAILDQRKTMEMYRQNIKKTNDLAVQYEFAVYTVNMAKETLASNPESPETHKSYTDMINEARQMLQKLADRSYPFAQYYLGDGYSSGLFSKGKEDWDRAFPLFVAASKHGHAESGYRAALCYEFGWGCRKDYAKAVQFYRASASKAHPGAATRLGMACLRGDMGLTNRYREGLKWLKRAAESADQQYNQAPYELGLLHVTGFGDDVFRDEQYAAQLFTQAAELGHPMANLKMGEAYEHGQLGCPRDPALSVHFYTGAAQGGVPEAMMALCAWYMVGAEPVLDKDENEAYEWAKRAAECGKQKFPPFTELASDFFYLCRSRQGRVRRGVLHRDGHRYTARPARGERLVRARSRQRRRAG